MGKILAILVQVNLKVLSAMSNLSDPLQGPDKHIGEACKHLLGLDETITIRSVARLVGLAHTTISRDQVRKSQVDSCIELQAFYRRISETYGGRIKKSESLDLAKAKKQIQELENEKAILIVSHQAMIHAVGEIGGFPAWKRLYAAYNGIEEKLSAMGAMPQAEVTIIRPEDS